MAAEKLDKDGNGTSIDNDLRLLCRARRNVGQCPCSFKLDESVWRTKKFYETTDDAGLNDFLDGRVAFFRKELSELRRGLDL